MLSNAWENIRMKVSRSVRLLVLFYVLYEDVLPVHGLEPRALIANCAFLNSVMRCPPVCDR